jgi:hypothetical protein
VFGCNMKSIEVYPDGIYICKNVVLGITPANFEKNTKISRVDCLLIKN